MGGTAIQLLQQIVA